MSRKAAVVACVAIVLFVLMTKTASAQAPVAGSGAATVVSGTVTDFSGKPVAHATVSAKSEKGGESATAESDAAGKYALTGLSLGDYDVTVSAAGYAAKTTHISVVDQQGTLDVALAAGGQQQEPVPNAPVPNAPTSPSLGDLGFSTQQTEGDPKLQALLKRRTEMLRVHQRLGLITLAPMAATLITGPMAKAKGRNGQIIKEPSDANLDFHMALGAATGALYGTTASYAIRAPRVPGTHKHGAIKVHEVLAWVHGPGMIATGVLGFMAYKQENSGEKAHGIAAEHGTVAWITTGAYGASIVAVSWPIHLKFWEKKQ
jgi:hypothetical protein